MILIRIFKYENSFTLLLANNALCFVALSPDPFTPCPQLALPRPGTSRNIHSTECFVAVQVARGKPPKMHKRNAELSPNFQGDMGGEWPAGESSAASRSILPCQPDSSEFRPSICLGPRLHSIICRFSPLREGSRTYRAPGQRQLSWVLGGDCQKLSSILIICDIRLK